MSIQIIAGLIVVLISIFLIIPGIVLAVVRRVVADEREETKKRFQEIKQILLDGGGKQINFTDGRGFQDALDDQAFTDALMKNYIKESINEIIENSRYFDQDYKPTSGTIQYGYTHNGAPRNIEDWYLGKQKKNRKIK